MINEFEKNIKPLEPVVFVNRPINCEDEDVIGLRSNVDSINKAIKQDANMIGVIAEYGVGKSSLIEMLFNNKKYKRSKPINISLWDYFTEENNIDLTKSFLYQFAFGTNKRRGRFLANYVNKRLNKNYGTISITLKSSLIWLKFLCIALLYLIYLILNSITDLKISTLIDPNNTSIINLPKSLTYLHYSAPIFFVLAIFLLIFTLRKTDIIYPFWKDKNSREIESNDIFETYTDIAYSIKKNKKQIVIIDDLDRVDNKNLVIKFLKELYRFQNMIDSNSKKILFS